MPRRVSAAILLAFVFHGLFILTARYRLSYDAYTHMLFADHYAKDWFSLWETRWYTGFDIVSYPPLAHQLIALLIPLLGFEKAFALLLWTVTTILPLGVYSFSRIFAGKTSSSYVALASAMLLPIFITAHIFGQYPFLTATLLALLNAACLAKFLREGGLLNCSLTVSTTAATMSAHHATLLIQPFLIFAITVFQLRKANWKVIFSRLLIYLVFAIPAGLIVIWPFWKWGMHQVMQTPIDHLSRHNFLADPFASVIFFWPFYFPIGAVIPFLFHKWPRKFLGLQISFAILFTLGLGGTTPLPSLFFGKNWEWLTYDRFAVWAVLMLTPFFGVLFIRLRRWIKTRFTLKPIPASLRGVFISASIFFVFTCSAIGSWLTPIIFPVQPARIDMKPIVDWLEAEDHYYWRYITFGFGDQFAYLSLLTDKATTLDGSYHTARSIPELRESGIGQIDTAYWALKGIPAIGPILQVAGEYGVRWGFVNREEFIPELQKNGWVYYKTLENGIQIWENPSFTFKPPIVPSANPFESFSWGFFPILSLITTIALGIVSISRQGEGIIRKVYSFIIGLLPLTFGFWYYKTIFEFKHEQVYFSYINALFFLGDGLALTSVILWLAVQAQKQTPIRFSLSLKLIFALCIWVTLSLIWSADWRISLYISLHFWMIFLLILSLQDWSEAWISARNGFCAALLIQGIAGFIELKSQSLQFLEPLHLHWPGLIDAASQGASILKFPNGENFLRLYGTLPHPNILAGFILTCIVWVLSLVFSPKNTNWTGWALLALGAFLLAVTFSRSAWLGLIISFIVIFLRRKRFDTRKMWLAVSITALTIALTLTPLRGLFLSRITSPATATEEFSLTGRMWLLQKAVEYTKEKPFTGLGAGSFVIQLAKQDGERNYVEPVHNIPVLVLSELGFIGVALFFAVIFVILREAVNAVKPKVILISALLAGLGVIALFDHYLWTLAPGRLMLGLVLGLWYGQVSNDDE